MSDERLIGALRALDRPVDVDPAFGAELYAVLKGEYSRRRQFRPRLTWLLVAALLTALLVGGVVAVGSGLLPLPWQSDRFPTPDYRLDLGGTELAEWEPERLGGPGDHFVARRSRPSTGDFLGDLTIERPDHVFERGGRESIEVPSDLVAWLTNHPSLDVLGIGMLQLDGREATVIDALPVLPPRDVPPDTWRSSGIDDPRGIHYPHLLPTLFLDGAWQYRFALVDLGDGDWLVATCGALRESWADAAQACGELFATWEWVEP